MALSECIASVSRQIRIDTDNEEEKLKKAKLQVENFTACAAPSDLTNLLDALRFVVECGKQHFNPNYRLQGPHELLVIIYSYHLMV